MLPTNVGTSTLVTCAWARSRSAPAFRITKTRGAGLAASIPAAIRQSARAARLPPSIRPASNSRMPGECDLVSDAIKDCSRRAGIVLDPFGGSGTTLIAAQKSGRSARLIDDDPLYCDVIIRRFQAVTGTPAIFAWTGQNFGEAAAERASA